MAQCPRHPGSLATDLCVECGEAVCGQCAWVMPDRRVFCPGCKSKGISSAPPPEEAEVASLPAARPRKQPPMRLEWSAPRAKPAPRPATKNSKAAIASIILPFVCVCYGAPFGLGLAIRELVRINDGRSTSSRTLVKASLWVNGVILGLTILGLALSGK